MIDSFNGKPMLWRFVGKWGRCHRSGGVTFLNLDMTTGGRMKNAAFAEGVRSGFGLCVFDISWTIEARCDEEMPERLLGGATIIRPELVEARQLTVHANGRVSLGGTRNGSAITAVASSDDDAGAGVREHPVPAVLSQFLRAWEAGDSSAAAACCTDDVLCVSPSAIYAGIAVVSEKQFGKPARRVDAPLRLVARDSGGRRWARPVVITNACASGGNMHAAAHAAAHAATPGDGPFYADVRASSGCGWPMLLPLLRLLGQAAERCELRQEFTLRETAGGYDKISKIELRTL